MSDVMRTALKGGGKIMISINQWANGDFHLCVTEDWERLTSIERADIPAEAMNAAEDPDGLLREVVSQLVRKAHMNWEVSGKSGAGRGQASAGEELELRAAINSEIQKLKKLLRTAQETDDEEESCKWEECIQHLEKVMKKLGRAKWRD